MAALARKFSCSMAVFFTAAITIVKQCILNYDELIMKRKKWENPYFPNLLTKLQEAEERILGTDSSKALRDKTLAVQTEQSGALDFLSEFYADFCDDFKDDPAKNEILKVLGFTGHYSKSQKGNQVELDTLLKQFNKNMTPELEKTIIDKGMDAEIIASIKAFASTFGDKNTDQETAKGSRKEYTAETINEVNGYYTTIIGIGTAARNKFKGNPQKQAMFSFAKTVKAIGKAQTSGGTDTPPAAPPAK